MNSTHERILELVSQHIGKVKAPTIVRFALNARKLSSQAVTDHDVAALIPLIERGVGLFGGAQSTERLRRDLQALTAAVEISAQRTVLVSAERDIGEARAAARVLCESGGLRSMAMQKITTIVSEVARNIVSYTPRGAVELALKGATRMFSVTATDEGSGIPNLDEIMAGRYKSKTGLGAGILGVKRLSDHFEIQTGSTGTRIRADVRY
jgi:serine/threonine-protein kinase RsbT